MKKLTTGLSSMANIVAKINVTINPFAMKSILINAYIKIKKYVALIKNGNFCGSSFLNMVD
ncbi:MAG: hypothetical protein SGI87_10845 [Flavobacteriales bacterium]|nr:hypothetical protein [Flavobacteriales bacterium]